LVPFNTEHIEALPDTNKDMTMMIREFTADRR